MGNYFEAFLLFVTLLFKLIVLIRLLVCFLVRAMQGVAQHAVVSLFRFIMLAL
jgi:hypothetical protein